MPDRRWYAGIVAGIALLGAVSVGCSNKTTTVVQPPGDATGISVTGKGEVQAPPDTGFISIGVDVHGTTVADARDGAAKAADAVISSIKKNGVDEKDIKTTGLSISPEYSYDRNGGSPRITGYRVTNTVEVKVRKLDNFSKVVDDAAIAGGDNARLNSIRFDIEDTTKLLQQAREAAMNDARAKADQLAKLGNVKLGVPLAISELQASNPPPVLAAPATGAADSFAKTPIQPGTGTVTVNVQVRWSVMQ